MSIKSCLAHRLPLCELLCISPEMIISILIFHVEQDILVEKATKLFELWNVCSQRLYNSIES